MSDEAASGKPADAAFTFAYQDASAFEAAYAAWQKAPGNEQAAKAFESECQRVALERGITATRLRAMLAEEARKAPANMRLPSVRRKRRVRS